MIVIYREEPKEVEKKYEKASKEEPQAKAEAHPETVRQERKEKESQKVEIAFCLAAAAYGSTRTTKNLG